MSEQIVKIIKIDLRIQLCWLSNREVDNKVNYIQRKARDFIHILGITKVFFLNIIGLHLVIVVCSKLTEFLITYGRVSALLWIRWCRTDVVGLFSIVVYRSSIRERERGREGERGGREGEYNRYYVPFGKRTISYLVV